MNCKCVRCERSCYAHDKLTKHGVKCCTDCAKEVVSLLHETIYNAIIRSHNGTHIIEQISTSKAHMIFRMQMLQADLIGKGAHYIDCTIEYWNRCETGTPRICVTDDAKEGNFAVMYPKANNMNSVRACVRMCMKEIIANEG